MAGLDFANGGQHGTRQPRPGRRRRDLQPLVVGGNLLRGGPAMLTAAAAAVGPAAEEPGRDTASEDPQGERQRAQSDDQPAHAGPRGDRGPNCGVGGRGVGAGSVSSWLLWWSCGSGLSAGGRVRIGVP